MIRYSDAEQYQLVFRGERLGYVYKRYGPRDGKPSWDRIVEVCWLDNETNYWLPPQRADLLTLDLPTEDLLAMRALAGLPMPDPELHKF